MKKEQIKKLLSENGIHFEEDKCFKNLTTFKTGGLCDFAVYPENEEQVIYIRKFSQKNNIPLIVLGRGSNVLAPDEDFNGMVLVTKEKLCRIESEGNVIKAFCGASLSSLCLLAKDKGLSGLEFAYGIPGSVGGAVLMNAGAFGGEVKDVIKKVTFLDENNEIRTIENKDCLFSYRTSLFDRKNYFILSAEFLLAKGKKEEIESRMNDILNRRKEKQPLDFPSAGSTFKRPDGFYAAALIEECGLKGSKVGGAEVSEKHSGFVINKDNAKSSDIKELCRKIQETVLKEKGVKLETEVRFL